MSKQAKVTRLLTETVRVLCQSSFDDWSEMKIQGLVGITLNNKDIFLIQINEVIDSCFGGGQPCSKGVQRAAKQSVASGSEESLDCTSVTPESSCRQYLRYASKSVEEISTFGSQRESQLKSKVTKHTTYNKQRSGMLDTATERKGVYSDIKKGYKRKGRQKRTPKYHKQHQDGNLKSVRHLTMKRKPLPKRMFCKALKASRVKTSNSIVRMEVSSSDNDSSNDSCAEQNVVDNQGEYICKVCMKGFSKLTHLATHYTDSHSENITARCTAIFKSLGPSCSKNLGFVKCKNISCPRYFNTHNGMLKHHAHAHGICLVKKKRVIRNSQFVKCKSKSCARLFRTRTGMIIHHAHMHGGKNPAKGKSIMKEESKEKSCFDCLSSVKDGVKVLQENDSSSWINEIKSDDLNVVSSASSDICKSAYGVLQSELAKKDFSDCTKQLDLNEDFIKEENIDIQN